ncbi:MAG: DUF3365 domain-containing protein [Gemmatales bacterium]|nr:DUF3365 domain-containing protein [Gemmatales bacterium]MDW8386022.1 DUF3365 domain-containing protein [Gemmatales bacterium]
MDKTRLMVVGILVFATLSLSGHPSQRGSAGDAASPDPAAVERARKTVRMLDDVYKSAIVLITDKYVHSKDDYPAGRIAVRWFDGISKKGWHEVRLIDATGEPYSPTNVAKDEFDKEGLKILKSGKDFHDKVVVEDGKPYLRAITPVPVVMDKCVLCHAHYKQAKKGEPIGALTYKVLIE